MIPYFVSDPRPFDLLIDGINALPEILAATVEYAVAEASDPALTILQADVPPSSRPFVWSTNPQANARAMAYYFAAIARGEIDTDGTRYRRSGRFQRSWDARVEESENSIDAILGNDFDKATYVVGNADGSIQQIPGHDRTGWTPFQGVATRWADDVVEIVSREYPGRIEKAFE